MSLILYIQRTHGQVTPCDLVGVLLVVVVVVVVVIVVVVGRGEGKVRKITFDTFEKYKNI